MKARINPINAPYSEEITADFNTVMPPGMPPLSIFRTMAHNPRVLHRMVMGGLLDKGSITVAQRELVILRACGLCKAEYEWGVHVAAFAKKAGFSQDQINDTTQEYSDSALWDQGQNLIIALVNQLHTDNQVSDKLWGKLAEKFAEDQLIELVMLAGLYHAVSFVVNACKIQNEPFAPAFPASISKNDSVPA
ncbi:MAG: carboxymuconolactone decarboxylase family protein [Bermanella sp.]